MDEVGSAARPIGSQALTLARLMRESTAWRLLRADNAPAILAILGRHLAQAQRRLAVPVLIERVEGDLEDVRADISMPSDAKTYCDSWRQAGFLVRRPAGDTREETYELSDGALLALTFTQGLDSRHGTVNASRLATIVERIHALAIETDPEVASRMALLASQRQRIDEEMARVEAGDFEVLSPQAAGERVRDILDLASQLPVDFALVRAEIERITRDLRRKVVEEGATRGSVLDEVFFGIDHLTDSEAGRSFEGFYDLVCDPELSGGLEEDLDALSTRPFAETLGPSSRRLTQLLPTLQVASREIHDVMTVLSRSLRRFVQSHAYAEYRAIDQALRRAERAGVEAAAHVAPFAALEVRLDIPVVPMTSIGTIGLHNPADDAVMASVEVADPEPVDLAALAAETRASEIDFGELSANVNACLAEVGPSTVAEILAAHPATQSVASVEGLVLLAGRHAAALDGTEDIAWTTPDCGRRAGRIPLFLFKELIE